MVFDYYAFFGIQLLVVYTDSSIVFHHFAFTCDAKTHREDNS